MCMFACQQGFKKAGHHEVHITSGVSGHTIFEGSECFLKKLFKTSRILHYYRAKKNVGVIPFALYKKENCRPFLMLVWDGKSAHHATEFSCFGIDYSARKSMIKTSYWLLRHLSVGRMIKKGFISPCWIYSCCWRNWPHCLRLVIGFWMSLITSSIWLREEVASYLAYFLSM